jgi:hypothetical protein
MFTSLVRTRRSAIVVALAALAACADQQPTGPILTPDVNSAILDAPRGGDPDFFWLSPTVPTTPAPTGPFDATLLSQLAVEVCTLGPTQSCVAGPPLARFTSTSAPGPTRVKLEPPLERYLLSWPTNAYPVEPSRFYRISVFKGQSQLGYLDVDIVRTA